MKILICDYVGNSQQWLEQFTLTKNYEVVGTITPASDKNLLLEKNWDYLLVFEEGLTNFFEPLFLFMNIAPERVIYATDLYSWINHPAAVFALINPKTGGGTIYRQLVFFLGMQINYFTTCTTADGLNYIATSNDTAIMGTMYRTQKTWAQDEMQIFHELAQKFYQIDDSAGLFLDLGANIGTTGIYFLKKLTPNLKLLAFEPDAENFKMLRANLIINDLEEKSIVEKLGLGIEESEQTMYRNLDNPGGNGILANLSPGQENAPAETIKVISLDKYFEEKNLNAEDIKYIWIDTEGFEPQVLLGAQNILRKNPAPVFMEFNPHLWQVSGYYEKMMDFLKPLYPSYIWIKEAMTTKNITPHPIEKLLEFQNSTADVGILGDIFLIKKS